MNMAAALSKPIASGALNASDVFSGRRTDGSAPGSHLPSNQVVWTDDWDALRQLSWPSQNTTPNASRLLTAFNRDHPASRAFDLLRTRLVRTLEQKGWNRIAVCAPTTGCGSTFTAVNLAMSMSRMPDTRTVLVDLNQRAPGIAGMLNVGGIHKISEMLSGDIPYQNYMLRLSDTLAVALNSCESETASEQLLNSTTGQILQNMQDGLDPDLVLYDLPAMLEYDDLAAFLPQVDGVLLISDGTQTTKHQIEECERVLDGQAQLLGVVLNRGRCDKG